MTNWNVDSIAENWQELGQVSSLEILQARFFAGRMANACGSDPAGTQVFLLTLLALHRRGHTAVSDSDLVNELVEYPVVKHALPALLDVLRSPTKGMVACVDAPLAQQALVVWSQTSSDCVWGFQRAWLAETRIARQIELWAAQAGGAEQHDSGQIQAALDQATHLCFSHGQQAHEHQIAAVRSAMLKPFSIVSGGPGTGKTTVVKMIVSAVCSLYNIEPDRVVLCAPTGRAKARLEESIHKDLPADSALNKVVGRTLHSLLRYRTDGTPAYHIGNPLPYDLVVVDEVSMVDAVQFASLVGALAAGSRLVVVGDKDQLPSVESGAVLADLIQRLGTQVSYLTKNFRTDRAIMQWWSDLQTQHLSPNHDLRITPESLDGHLLTWCKDWLGHWEQLRPRSADLLNAININQFKKLVECGRILCLTNQGEWGRAGLNERCRNLVHSKQPRVYTYYDGEPLIIEQNQQIGDVALYNGDLGVAWIEGRRAYGLFYSAGVVRKVELSRVQSLSHAYAITVHKSQGSEFVKVIFVMPSEDSRLVSTQLVYTAITRARNELLVCDPGHLLDQPLATETRGTWLAR